MWWLGVALLVVVMAAVMARPSGPLSRWINERDVPERLQQTPFDATSDELSAHWQTLVAAEPQVADGQTLTVRSTAPGLEMSLYMMAVGLLPQARLRPSSYYGQPTPEEGARAGLVIVSGADCGIEPGLIPIARLPNGWLCERAPE